jgi:polyisoprenyl-teichoic acid--peptidoglycan teichoic acid transferase
MGDREHGVQDPARPGGAARVSTNGANGSHRESFRTPYERSSGVVRGASPPRRRKRPFKRILFPLAALLGLLVGPAIGYFNTPHGQANWKVMHQLVTPQRDLTEVFHAEQAYVLLLGLDHVLEGKRDVSHRADSILVASTDFTSKQIRLVSLPRDSWVPHYLNGELIREHDKLGHTYIEGGVQCTEETVEQLLGVPIQYYVTINFVGFQKIIDAIGGIEIDVEKRMKYNDNWGDLHINLKKGPQLLNGEQAMGYARFRSDLTGDIGRMGRQQKVLRAMLEKMNSPAMLPKLPQLFEIFKQNVDTNMSMDQLLALAQNMDEYSGDGMQTMTVENYGPFDGEAYVWGRHSHEGRNMAQYLPPTGIEAAREFLTNLEPPPPPEPPLDEQDAGWTDGQNETVSAVEAEPSSE